MVLFVYEDTILDAHQILTWSQLQHPGVLRMMNEKYWHFEAQMENEIFVLFCD